MTEELMLIVFLLFGIALGLWIGWILWREPSLNYMDNDNE